MLLALKKRLAANRIEEAATAYMFLLPFVLLWIPWFFLPLLQSVNMSFYKFSFVNPDDTAFIGLNNYIKLFSDPYFWSATGNTLLFVLVTVPVTTVLALPVAYILNMKIKARTFLRTVYYLPNVISPIAVTTVFMYLFVKGALLSKLFSMIGIPDVTWFTNVSLALPFVMFIYIWQVTGFYIVIYLSGLQTIPEQVYESARIDGAGTVKIFVGITIPMMRPVLVFGVTYSIINAFQIFDQIAAISQGGPLGSPAGASSTMVTFFYSNAFQYYEMGYGCAGAIILFILILTVSIIQKRIIGSDEI